jgi:hypothetical protein
MNVDKQNIMDKAKSSMEKQFMAQRSTGFRTQLLNKGLPVAMKDTQVFNTASAFQDAQSKAPSLPRELEIERE